MNQICTSFSTIYDSFLTRVTSDMYMEYTELDTLRQLQDLLLAAIPRFKFPRFDLFDYDEGYYDSLGTYTGVESEYKELPAAGWVGGNFNVELSKEEINILSICMVIEWLGQQLTTTDNTTLKYSGSDFKFASQANHMAKIKVLMDKYENESVHLQNLYKRRIVEDGRVKTTIPTLMSREGLKHDFEVRHRHW